MQVQCNTTEVLLESFVEVDQKAFNVWKGRDVWHKDISVQIRLDPDDSVIVSCYGTGEPVMLAEVTLEELYESIKQLITGKQKKEKQNA